MFEHGVMQSQALGLGVRKIRRITLLHLYLFPCWVCASTYMCVCVSACVFKRKGMASDVLIGQSLRKTPSSLSLIHCCHTFPS